MSGRRVADLLRFNREAPDAAAGFAVLASECHRLCPGTIPDGWPTTELALVETRHMIRWLAFGPAGMDLQPWDSGGCLHVSQAITDAFNVPLVGGCYAETTHEGTWHYLHYWNTLTDGRILDVTADTFDLGPGVHITHPTDVRYLAGCDCGNAA